MPTSESQKEGKNKKVNGPPLLKLTVQCSQKQEIRVRHVQFMPFPSWFSRVS